MSEKSPYLLQHAYNPVDWYPWGEEAFEKARKEHKPIFLSIGYSTCHWCHVMAHESFEDPEVAKLMNDVFVSIKVDREERPDIDNIYMAMCQIMTSKGGWPLTIIMTPDKEPFFTATYIPKKKRFGQVGMLELIPKIKEIWTNQKDKVYNTANQLTAVLKKASKHVPGQQLNESTLKLTHKHLVQNFDRLYGGFGSAPKFPIPHNLLFLLRHWKRTSDNEALSMAEKTLEAMRHGGIYDHVGFGFHRYSTDSKWILPHFEKMLYDQAMLAMAYTEAYQASEKNEYKKIAHEIFTYVLRDMTSSDGAFYSAEDADSEGEEGKFYLWRYGELERLLTTEEMDVIIKVFNIKKDGNFSEESSRTKTGLNILYQTKSLEKISNDLKMSKQDFEKQLEIARKKLFSYRKKRIHPHKDDKILTDWNGLMIASFAKGAQVFDEPKYAEAAQRAVDFILKNMRGQDSGLFHRYRDGQAAIVANVNDYVFLIFGLIELYEATFDVKYLKSALNLNVYLLRHFWDTSDGGFYFTHDKDEKLLTRRKEIYDGAIPSGNSLAMLNLLRLSRIFADPLLEEKAAMIGRAFPRKVKQLPSAFTQLMVAVDYEIGPSYELVIVGNSQTTVTKEMIKTINRQFIPNKVVILRPSEQKSPDIIRLAKFIRHQKSINGKTTVYICKNYTCQTPLTDIKKVIKTLNPKKLN